MSCDGANSTHSRPQRKRALLGAVGVYVRRRRGGCSQSQPGVPWSGQWPHSTLLHPLATHSLARYATVWWPKGMEPIVRPPLLMALFQTHGIFGG